MGLKIAADLEPPGLPTPEDGDEARPGFIRFVGCPLILSRTKLSSMKSQEQTMYCEIRVRGLLSDTLLLGFPDLAATGQDGETVLAGELPDQSALFGVLAQVEALGLELLEVRRDHVASRSSSIGSHDDESPSTPRDSLPARGGTYEQKGQGTRS